MPGSEPLINSDLSVDIRTLEHVLTACALKVDTIKDCQNRTDTENEKPAQGAH